MYKTFGETIASLRRAHGMRQQTLADALAEAGVPVSNQAVSKWENDATLPNAQQFLTLCRVLDVDDIAGTFSGGDAGGLLAGLNAEGRRRALEYIALLRESKRFAAAPEPAVLRSLPLYSLAVSAGTGQFLDGESYEMQPVGPEVPEEANFGVRVAGDSMEPALSQRADRLGAPAADARPRRDRRVPLRQQRLSQAAPARRRARVSALAQPGLCRSGDLGGAAAARARKSGALITNKKLPAERMVSAGSFPVYASFQCSRRSDSSATVCTVATAPAASSSPGSAYP